MKKNNFLFISVLFLVCNFSVAQKLANPNARFYNDNNFKHEFEISTDESKVKLKKQVEYFWFKSGIVQSSFSDYSGKPLHGSYQRLTLDANQLVEKGNFEYGLKKGDWKYWFPNGKLKKHESWKKGKLHGLYEEYDQEGNISLRGTYKQGFKHGIWTNYVDKKQFRYQKNKLVPLKKMPFWKKIFAKKKDA